MRSLQKGLGLLVLFVLLSDAGADDWGTVKGHIRWGANTQPVQKPIMIPAAFQMQCLAKGPIPDEEFVIAKDGSVANVFVWLIDASNPKKKLPIHPALQVLKVKEVEIDQPCCKFIPHALAVRGGQVLIAKNSSPIGHNFNWTGGPDNPGNNMNMPPNSQLRINQLVASPRPITVACNIHPWMKAWIRVFDHPYYAVTEEDGKFEIKNAPSGKYNLVIWHEGVGWGQGGKVGQPITIPANGTVEINDGIKPIE